MIFKKWLIRPLKACWHIVFSTALDFWKLDGYNKASTLSFYTLQSIVPFLAVILAVAKGFGFEEDLKLLLKATFVEQKEILSYAIQIALSMLQNISSGKIVGFGAILLLWTSINLVGYIELVFNEVWRVVIFRNVFQRLKDFLFAVVVFPMIFVASSSVTLYLKTEIQNVSYFSILDQILIVPWLLSCVLFGALYFFIPNSKIRIAPRLLVSMLAGSAFQIWQIVFINLQIYMFSYNVVYGAFALLPLFIIWLQFSWMIAVVGAILSFHIENWEYYSEERAQKVTVNMSQAELGVLVLLNCLKEFYAGKPPLPVTKQAGRLGISQEIALGYLSCFEKKNLVYSFYNKQHELCYQPLLNLDQYKILQLVEILEPKKPMTISVECVEMFNRVSGILQAASQGGVMAVKECTISSFFKNPNTEIN